LCIAWGYSLVRGILWPVIPGIFAPLHIHSLFKHEQQLRLS